MATKPEVRDGAGSGVTIAIVGIISVACAIAGVLLAFGVWSLTGDRQLDLNIALPVNCTAFVVAVVCVLADRQGRKKVRA